MVTVTLRSMIMGFCMMCPVAALAGADVGDNHDNRAQQDSPDVVIYSKRDCYACKHARTFFKARNVSYKEYDVQMSRKGRQDFRKLRGRGVPIIMVNGWRYDGFVADSMDHALNR